jgi:C1A family cysteine protease
MNICYIFLIFIFFRKISAEISADECLVINGKKNLCHYMARFGKSYNNDKEMDLRLERIKSVENEIRNGVEFGHTSRSDRFPHELKSNSMIKKKHYKNVIHGSHNEHVSKLRKSYPPIDWRNVNGVSFVSPVKDQGDCGGCFAFASATVMEYWLKRHGHPPSISVQHLLDCAEKKSCEQGGLMSTVFEYASRFSVMLDSEMPYFAKDKKCPDGKVLSHVKVDNWRVLSSDNVKNAEGQLEYLLHHYGPVSVGVDSKNWDNYRGGIYRSSMCGTDIDHAVSVVGYTKKYWIIKNSWSRFWGLGGYLHLERGNNACGVAEYIVYVSSAYPVLQRLPSK